MKKQIRNRMYMYQLVQDILKDNQNIWANTPKFVSHVDAFVVKFEQLKVLAEQEKAFVLGVKTHRDEDRNATSKKAFRIASALSALAIEVSDFEMHAQMRITEHQLSGRSHNETLLLIDRILIHALAHTAELEAYGISAADVQELETLRAALVVNILSPRKAIIKRKNAKVQIEEISKELELLLKEGIDKLMKVLKDEHPHFYNAYFDSRMVIKLGGSNSDPTAGNSYS